MNAASIRVHPDELLAAIEYDALILAQMALSANREARFNDRPALREVMRVLRLHVAIMLQTFDRLPANREASL
jgi:hypothetical protein